MLWKGHVSARAPAYHPVDVTTVGESRQKKQLFIRTHTQSGNSSCQPVRNMKGSDVKVPLGVLLLLSCFGQTVSDNALTKKECRISFADAIMRSGYVTCFCLAGYFGNGFECVPKSNCRKDSICCQQGFQWDEKSKGCVDVNECDLMNRDLNKCVPRETCKNYNGNYVCSQDRQNGRTPCGSDICDENEDCLLVQGSPRCTDPCEQYQTLDGSTRLSSKNSTGKFLSDRFLFGWYRYSGNMGVKIQEGCILGGLKCGSAEPFTLLPGSHPDLGSGIQSATLLMNKVTQPCSKSSNILIKACPARGSRSSYNGFYIYKFSGSLSYEVICTDPTSNPLSPLPLPPTPVPTTTTVSTTTTKTTTTTTTVTPTTSPTTVTPTTTTTTTTVTPTTTPTTVTTTTTPTTVTPTTTTTTTTTKVTTTTTEPVTTTTSTIKTTTTPTTVTPTTTTTTTTVTTTTTEPVTTTTSTIKTTTTTTVTPITTTTTTVTTTTTEPVTTTTSTMKITTTVPPTTTPTTKVTTTTTEPVTSTTSTMKTTTVPPTTTTTKETTTTIEPVTTTTSTMKTTTTVPPASTTTKVAMTTAEPVTTTTSTMKTTTTTVPPTTTTTKVATTTAEPVTTTTSTIKTTITTVAIALNETSRATPQSYNVTNTEAASPKETISDAPLSEATTQHTSVTKIEGSGDGGDDFFSFLKH